ncbi:AtpZ/AtpI family protein [Helicobacter sp. 13S00401-1]|uniref:AtpZ/AtpI family protein n=1 Tax=Helicobacter sp. 13S00401-1 TaxID=1905758 RepID=UPI000BA60054|nr:AtpZ/AtpI family protein [Helicobacter sp. 13S00401-1]
MEDTKWYSLVSNAYNASLGISMVVAVLIGLGIGYGIYKLTGWKWFIVIGLAYGVAAAILNVYKAYKRLKKDMDSLQEQPKYKEAIRLQNEALEKREAREKARKAQKHKE